LIALWCLVAHVSVPPTDSLRTLVISMHQDQCQRCGQFRRDDPDPATVDEDTILSRLRALNIQRARA
jgi:hypothetical protein